jgi:hypothetical protein
MAHDAAPGLPVDGSLFSSVTSATLIAPQQQVTASGDYPPAVALAEPPASLLVRSANNCKPPEPAPSQILAFPTHSLSAPVFRRFAHDAGA